MKATTKNEKPKKLNVTDLQRVRGSIAVQSGVKAGISPWKR
jgi:hypothetical protein